MHGRSTSALPTDSEGSEGSDDEVGPSTVLVVDDHVVFAQLVERALSHEPDLTCVGVASSLAEARRMCAIHRPDVVIMDVRLQDGDGIDGAAELVAADPTLRVVVLSAFIDSRLMQRAARAGATALQAKDGELDDLLDAIRYAEPGSLAVHPRLLHQLVNADQTPTTPVPVLTQREHEVLRMLAAGHDLGIISRDLSISINTCRGHVKSVLAKLGAHSQLQAVVIAMRAGLIGADEDGG
jgi:DNA-binding NarL/FixJ family response regulator